MASASGRDGGDADAFPLLAAESQRRVQMVRILVDELDQCVGLPPSGCGSPSPLFRAGGWHGAQPRRPGALFRRMDDNEFQEIMREAREHGGGDTGNEVMRRFVSELVAARAPAHAARAHRPCRLSIRRFNEDVLGSADAGSSEESSELDPELVRSFQRSLLGAGVPDGDSDLSADVSSLDIAELAELAGGGRAILRSDDGDGSDGLRRELEEYGVDPAELGLMMATVASKRSAPHGADAARGDATQEPGFAPGELLPYSEEGAEGPREAAQSRGAGNGGSRGFWTSEESSGPDDGWVDDVWTRLRRQRAEAGGTAAARDSGSDPGPVNEALAEATGGRVQRWADIVSPAFPAAPGDPPAWFTPILARELAACLPEGFPIATVPSHAELCGAASMAPPLCQKEMIRCVLEARTAFRDDAWVERQMQKVERNSRSILDYENAVQLVLRGDDPAVAEAADARIARARRAAAARAARNPETVERAALKRLRERLTAGPRAMAAIRRRQSGARPRSRPPRHVTRFLTDLHRRQRQWIADSPTSRRSRRWKRGHRLAPHALQRQSISKESVGTADRLHAALGHWAAAEARRREDPLASRADAESARILAALRHGPKAFVGDGSEEEEEDGNVKEEDRLGPGMASAAIALGEEDWEAAETMAAEQREAEVARFLAEASQRQAVAADSDAYDVDEPDSEEGLEGEDPMVVDEPTEYAESTDDVAEEGEDELGEMGALAGHAAAAARARRELSALERAGASGRRAQLSAVQRRLQAETGAEQVSVAPRGPRRAMKAPAGGAGDDMDAIAREAFVRAGMSAHLDSVESTLGVGLDDLLDHEGEEEEEEEVEGGEDVAPPPRRATAAAGRSGGSRRPFSTWARGPALATPCGPPRRGMRALATVPGGNGDDDERDGAAAPLPSAFEHDFDQVRELDAARRLNPLRVEPEDRVATRDPLALRRRNRRSRIQRGLQRSLDAEVERDDPLAPRASPRQQRVATRIQETVDRVLEANTLRSRLLARTAPHITRVSISPCMKQATVRWALPHAVPGRGAWHARRRRPGGAAV